MFTKVLVLGTQKLQSRVEPGISQISYIDQNLTYDVYLLDMLSVLKHTHLNCHKHFRSCRFLNGPVTAKYSVSATSTGY